MLLCVVLISSLGWPHFAAAQNTVGTVIVAHGADRTWNERVMALARQVKSNGPVEVSFLMGPGAQSNRFQDVIARLEQRGVREIVVVPLLISSYSGHYEQIRYLAGATDSLDHTMLHHLHMGGIERARTSLPVRVTRAIDDAPEAARILAQHALQLATKSSEQALLIIGHGPNSPEDFAAWMRNFRAVADTIRAWHNFRDVRVALIQDDAPAAVRREAVLRARDLLSLQHAATREPVIVVPFVISKGVLTTQKLPADLAGLPMAYTSEGLLEDLALARWVEARIANAYQRTSH